MVKCRVITDHHFVAEVCILHVLLNFANRLHIALSAIIHKAIYVFKYTSVQVDAENDPIYAF